MVSLYHCCYFTCVLWGCRGLQEVLWDPPRGSSLGQGTGQKSGRTWFLSFCQNFWIYMLNIKVGKGSLKKVEKSENHWSNRINHFHETNAEYVLLLETCESLILLDLPALWGPSLCFWYSQQCNVKMHLKSSSTQQGNLTWLVWIIWHLFHTQIIVVIIGMRW